MKKSFLFPLIILLLFFSCNKNKQGESLVIGNWKMTKIWTGWGPVQIIPSTENYLLKIGSDHHYQEFHNDTLTATGEWHVYEKFLPLANTKGWAFKKKPGDQELSIVRKGNTLEFYPFALADGGGVEYIRY